MATEQEFNFIIMTPGGVYGPTFTTRGRNWMEASEEAERKATEEGYEVEDVIETREQFILVIED